MRARVLIPVAALIALFIIPSTALAAPKKVQFRFSSTAYSVVEGNKTFNVTVQRSGRTSVAASASVTDNGTGSAATPGNYTFTPATVNFAAGETTKTVPVTIKDNTLFEPNHTVVLKLTAVTPTGAGSQVKTPTTTITILEDDGPGTIELASPNFNVVEGAGIATITLSRTSSATNLRESVDYTTTALAAATGHATAGVDYLTTSGTVTFAPNESTKTFQVPVLDDSIYEGAETLNLTLSNAKNLTTPAQPPNVGPAATMTIVDDDVPTFAFSQATYSVNEPGPAATGTATISVTRGGATNIPASVDYGDAGTGTAPASDYTLTPGTINFAAGETSKTFPVTIVDNGVQEANRTVGLELTDSVSTDQLATATLSIVDDDNPAASVQFSDVAYSAAEGGAATVTATLSKAVGSTVTVHYATANETANGTNNPATADVGPTQNDYAANSGTLTFNAGETSKTFQVQTHQDAAFEGDETLDLQLSSPTNSVLGAPSTAVMTIADDDLAGSLEFDSLRYDVNENAPSGQATVIVHRLGGTTGTVTVDYATSDGSASAPDDYAATSGTLTFNDGDTQKPISVPIVWDAQAEGPQTINLALSNPTGGADIATNSAAAIHIADDGASGPVRFTASSFSANEAAGQTTVTVTRLGGSLGGPVTVDYATGDGTATAGSDYTATSGTLTFAPGEATKSFTVPVANDSAQEDGETFQVTLSNVTGGANMGTPSGAAVTIADDDAAPAAPVGTTPSTQSTPANPNPSGSQTAASDKRAPKLTLSAKKIQKAFKAKLLVLGAKCDENCKLTVVARVGKAKKTITLGKVSAKAARGAKATLKVKLSKKALAKLAKVLKRGKVKITISVVAADAAGNKSSAARGVTVKR